MKAMLVAVLLAISSVVTAGAQDVSPRATVAASEYTPEQTAYLIGLANESLRRWGHPYQMRIRFVNRFPTAEILGHAEPSWDLNGPPPASPDPAWLWDCQMGFTGVFWSGAYDAQAVMDHEIGHCLGLKDLPVEYDSVMADAWGGIRRTDRIWYASLWKLPLYTPPTHRLFVPLVVN